MLIGLTGPAGSGKTTAAKHLVESHGFIHLKFAGPLKAMMCTLCDEMGVPLDHREAMIEGDQKELTQGWLNQREPRHAMQTLGTEWGRKCMGEDFWVNVAKMRLLSECEAYPPSFTPRIVFDDVRFENEAAMIREMGGTIVHLSGRGGIEGSHESEGGVKVGDGDLTVQNIKDVNWMLRCTSFVVRDLTSE